MHDALQMSTVTAGRQARMIAIALNQACRPINLPEKVVAGGRCLNCSAGYHRRVLGEGKPKEAAGRASHDAVISHIRNRCRMHRGRRNGDNSVENIEGVNYS
jgi:hypothetical protein